MCQAKFRHTTLLDIAIFPGLERTLLCNLRCDISKDPRKTQNIHKGPKSATG